MNLVALRTTARYVSSTAIHLQDESLHRCGIYIGGSQGVYWHECLENDIEEAIKLGTEWVMVLDGDSMVTVEHVQQIVKAAADGNGDAYCALQVKRGTMTAMGDPTKDAKEEDELMPTNYGHFGLTMLRTAGFEKLTKPWFLPIPSKSGDWREGSRAADMRFWDRWIAVGNSLRIVTSCRIGHLEECVSYYDDENRFHLVGVQEWLNVHKL